jgi:hypothetical protein
VHDQRKLIVTQKFETELAFVELSGAPKLLLAPPFPANLITVPACYDCNQSFQKDDEYTRFITGIDFRASKNQDARSKLRLYFDLCKDLLHRHLRDI